MELVNASPCLLFMGTIIFSSCAIISIRYGSISNIGELLLEIPPLKLPLFTRE